MIRNTKTKVALVHDYIKEFGGAERVLKVLTNIYPEAPIYSAFKVKNSFAGKEFSDNDVRESWLAPFLKIDKFYSPFRFLTPVIWKSMDLSEYDLVITSCSWYITRGFKVGSNTKVVAYCHTPPRWLYGYETSVGFTKYWPVRVYSAIVGHFMKMYDYKSAQEVDYWLANSKNVSERVKKFYRKEATVIYPPVEVEKIIEASAEVKKDNFYLIVSRLAGSKGLEEAAKAAKKGGFKLKIAGEAHGFSDVEEKLKKLSGGNIELIGRVSDDELYKLYAKARGFIALAKEEDFGITPVEAMAAGTPVIAYDGGGYRESVIDGETGVLIGNVQPKTIVDAVKKSEKSSWSKKSLQKHAKKFSKERFIEEIKDFVDSI